MEYVKVGPYYCIKSGFHLILIDEIILLAESAPFLRIFTDSPLMPDMLYIAGNAYYLKEDYLRASNSFNDITQNFPDSEIAREAVEKEGICLYHLELISGSIDKLEQYLRQTINGKNTDEALYYLGLSYERSGQLELAANYLKRLVLQYPSHQMIIETYFRLGKLYFETKNFADSEKGG